MNAGTDPTMGATAPRSWRCFDRWCGALLLAVCLLWVVAAHAADWGLQVRDAPDGGAAVVVTVAPGSPAALAGLRPGDRVLRAQDSPVRNTAEFQTILRNDAATLVLGLSRDGWEKDVRLQSGGGQKSGKAWIGVRVADAVPDATGTGTPGALITGVSPDGPAAQAGLKAGDVVTRLEGRPVDGAATLASLLEDWPMGRSMRLAVTREGWGRDVLVTPTGAPAAPLAAPQAPAPQVAPAPAGWTDPPPGLVPAPRAATSAGPPQGNKALVAIGDFKVRAATANQAIGDGLREMLVTALHRSGNYVVVERMDIQGLAAEQALSRSRMAREGSAVPEHQMEVADIIVYGAVTEFEGAARGSSVQASVPKSMFSFGRDSSTAHMAIDVRVVDVASGRVLGSQSVVGDASSSQTALSGTPTVRGVGVPAGLGVFSNTPMEQAIRSCVEKAVGYVSATVPPGYFRHR
jgi:curli biogenesis system outer membrane secretion channel CsgG